MGCHRCREGSSLLGERRSVNVVEDSRCLPSYSAVTCVISRTFERCWHASVKRAEITLANRRETGAYTTRMRSGGDGRDEIQGAAAAEEGRKNGRLELARTSPVSNNL